MMCQIYYQSKQKVKMIRNLYLLMLSLLATLAKTQYNPLWQATPYIEAVSYTVLNNNHVAVSPFTLAVTFTSVFTTPKLALTIPSIRFTPGNVLAFRVYDTSLTTTGFTHNLVITSTNTSIAFLTCRYIVFNTAILTKEFQVYSVANQAGTTINAIPNGSNRFENFGVALSAAATVANGPVCLPFLAGITATSNDHFQVNLTCSILAASASQATVTATVYASTSVSLLSLYLIVWDPVVLASQSFFFADSAITSTYYNVQKTFLTLPKGYIDKNYIGGLTSFSAFSNQQLNFTLSNILVSTTLSSLYDSAAQLQIRTRNCSQVSAPWYNKADGLCYPLCPSYTYSIASAFLCTSCSDNCVTCLNGTTCTVCSTGLMVSNGVCVCSNSSYLYNGACYGCHYSCLTCTATGQYYNCLSCDPTAYRVSNPVSGTCPCLTGYIDTYSSVCTQICGDGVARSDACDDGNSASGDGCSSSCTIQKYFICEKNVALLSSCYFVGNLTISELKTFKLDYENRIIIFFQVLPWIDALCQLANPVSLTTNFSSTSTITYSCQHNLLVYTVDYFQPIEGKLYTAYLKPTASGIFSRLPPVNVTFEELGSDNGYKLMYYTAVQYKVAESFHYICMVLSYFILFSAFLFIFGRLKWMGNLLFFSMQFQYLSMVVIPNFNPMLAGLSQLKTVLGYNQLYRQQEFDLPKYTSFSVLNINKQYLYNVNIMVIIQGIALFLYIIYHITYRNNELLCKKYGGDPQKTYKALRYGKILIFFDWEFFMFWTFFNMTEQITAMILFSQMVDYSLVPLLVFNAACILLTILPLFVRRKLVKSYTELLYPPDRGHQQSILTLFVFILMYACLGIALTTAPMMYFVIFVFPLGLIAYLICRRPFQSKWMRAAYFINNLCIIFALVYNQLIIQFQDDVYYLPFGSLGVILLDWIFNLVIWGRQAYVICKYGGERDLNELLQSNTKTSSNENQDNFFKATIQDKGNQSFLNSIIKNQAKQTKSTYRAKKLDQDMPEGLREEHKAKLDEQEEQERDDLRKKREKWMKEMRETNDIREVRERTKAQLQTTAIAKRGNKSLIRSTGQKGVDENVIRAINNSFTGRNI